MWLPSANLETAFDCLDQCAISFAFGNGAQSESAPQTKKARGAILGKPENLSAAAAASGRGAGRVARAVAADLFAAKVKPMIQELQTSGMSLSTIARKLNADHIRTASWKSTWTATSVRNVVFRWVP